METMLHQGQTVTTGQTVVVGMADSGRMITLHLGDRLEIQAPVKAGVTWRVRGGIPMLETVSPTGGEPSFLLRAVQAGRASVDVMPSGTAMPLPRPIRLIVTVN